MLLSFMNWLPKIRNNLGHSLRPYIGFLPWFNVLFPENSFNPIYRSPYYTVAMSPMPVIVASGAFFLAWGLPVWFREHIKSPIYIGLLFITLGLYMWWEDLIRETQQGWHTSYTVSCVKFGMILFITSEVMFFLSFFWAFFHSSLAPTPQIGCTWPPPGISPIDPFAAPLLNTAVLLTSGATVTWAHHALIEVKAPSSAAGRPLNLTWGLGLFFTILQAGEYYHAPFTIADGIYGSTFFVATGFHGLHVLIGTLFLIVCRIRMAYNHFTKPARHVGFEAAVWYWHFVDVIWILLYLCIYWWGS